MLIYLKSRGSLSKISRKKNVQSEPRNMEIKKKEHFRSQSRGNSVVNNNKGKFCLLDFLQHHYFHFHQAYQPIPTKQRNKHCTVEYLCIATFMMPCPSKYSGLKMKRHRDQLLLIVSDHLHGVSCYNKTSSSSAQKGTQKTNQN